MRYAALAATVGVVVMGVHGGSTEERVTRELAERVQGERDHRLWDMSRVDLMTDTHVYEVRLARKWAEAIGQTLYHAQLARKKPGICLLVDGSEADRRFAYRCQTVCAAAGIDLHVERIRSDAHVHSDGSDDAAGGE